MADKAGIVLRNARFCVTIRTVIHLHAVPGVFLKPSDILPPYVDAIPGQAVLLINREFLACSMIPVTGPALDLSHYDVGDMGKVDTVRLSGIDQPRDFFFMSHVFRQKFLLIRALAHGGFRIIVTIHARFQPWHADKSPVIPKLVAVETGLKLCIPLDDVGVRVDGVAEMKGLWLCRIEHQWKKNPTHDQGGDKTGQKIDQSTPQGIGDHIRIEGDKEVPEKEEPSIL